MQRSTNGSEVKEWIFPVREVRQCPNLEVAKDLVVQGACGLGVCSCYRLDTFGLYIVVSEG